MPNRFTADGVALFCIRRDQLWSLPGAAHGPRKDAVCLLPREWHEALLAAHFAPLLAAATAAARLVPAPSRPPRRQAQCFDAQVIPMTAGAAC